jgi:CII-binding regulator of phage lambda lysogenization HflD
MRSREGIEKDIEKQKEMIELERKFNENSGELSFLYWQLSQLEKELENYEEEKE